MRRTLLLLGFTLAVSSVRAPTNAVACPVQLKAVDLLPAKAVRVYVSGPGFNRNLERVLRIRYKNVSGRDIEAGQIGVTTSLYEPGPVYAKITHGEQSISLPAKLRAKEQKTLKSKILTSGVPPRTWLQGVIFSDGSRWTTSDPSQCAYVTHPGDVRTHTGIPELR